MGPFGHDLTGVESACAPVLSAFCVAWRCEVVAAFFFCTLGHGAASLLSVLLPPKRGSGCVLWRHAFPWTLVCEAPHLPLFHVFPQLRFMSLALFAFVLLSSNTAMWPAAPKPLPVFRCGG
jgi:hypothetical protein